MYVKVAVLAAIGLATQAAGSAIDRSELLAVRANNNGGGNGASATCLSSNAVQSGSASTGQVNGVPAAGQVNSATDDANFINFCSGKTLTNGLQVKTGSCNGVVMGEIPATTAMVSTIILSPQSGQALANNQTFNVTVQIQNMQLGSFTNATSTYYSAPQQLSNDGTVIGHTHITIQDLGSSQNPTTPPDASKFVFFKGINDAGNGNGKLTTAVTGGLPAGNFRVCTMAGSSNHQPLLMPVAQRGAQDDCIRITVGGGNAGGNGGNAGGNGGNAGGNGGANGGGTNNAGAGSASSASSSAATSTSTASAGSTNNGGGRQGGQGGGRGGGGNGNGRGSASSTTAAAASATSSAAAKASGKGSGSGSGSAGSVTSSAASSTSTSSSSSGTTNNAGAGSTSSSSSAGAIGGIAAPPVTDSGDATRPFEVNGNTFVGKDVAVQRSCAIQNNACANAVNSGQITGSTVGDCNAQEDACNAAGGD